MKTDILKDLKKNPFEFILLFLILLTGALFFLYFSFNSHYQRRVIYATGAAYCFWSLIHHYRRGDLQLSIVVEYILIALFATILLTGTLF
ncbi:hypothetical protein KKC08_04660 [Patescibacteria group bacterium]|nr:hypothetical protein [Patescibacteria group bacterium]MCG2702657.1 hypothetical protein [Candidatus Parcubacteria bacterium]MBU4264866.1 hypothetical protein [Patescibacteria group bacterium]MBU4389737.1 hypothetical protein [Patescibacteria group bacterium]MBU4397431.1 hypothetical protein [Patescibacteria group bacterium]